MALPSMTGSVRYSAAMMRPPVLLLALLALLVVPTLAAAAIAPVSPAAGLATANSAPTFTWTLDGGSVPGSLQVSTNPAVDPSTNRLVGASIDQPLAADAAGYRPGTAQQLYAGVWNWRVVGTTAGVADATPTQAFTVRPVVSTPRLKVAATRKGTAGTVRIHTNTARFRMRVRILHGRSTCLNRVVTRSRARARIGAWDTYRIYCYPYGGVARGTRVTTIVTVTGNGVSRSARATAIAR